MFETTTLGTICDLVGGYAYKSADFTDTGIPVIKIGDVTGGGSVNYRGMSCVSRTIANETAQYAPSPRDTLISMTGANVGKTCRTGWSDIESRINQRVGRFVPKAGFGYSKHFIHYLVSSEDAYAYFSNAAHGSAQPNISGKLIESLPIPSIPAPIANNIGATLAALDEKIELNRQTNNTLETMARALFRDWFVDFGPTRAKMAEQVPYLARDVWELLPDVLDDATDLPKGWRWGVLADLAALNSETWGARNHPQSVCYVDLSNTKWGYIDAVEEYTWKDAPGRARRVLRAGDTIVGCVRPGNGSFAYIGDDGLTGSTGFAVLRPIQQSDNEFVWAAATSSENLERLSHLADGGAYPAVRPEIVAATEVAIPTEAVRQAYAGLCSPLLEKVERNKREMRVLEQTRDDLLPKLMSGEITVRDAEEAA